MSRDDDFFIGWSSDASKVDRRFMLGASFALIAGGGALGAALAFDRPPVGDGFWDQGTARTLRGVLSRDAYPALRTRDLDGAPRTVLLVTSGKTAPQIAARYFDNATEVTGTLITRGRHAMMAVAGIEQVSMPLDSASELDVPASVDRGPVKLVGEILDAKCWFGAMRPGYGKTHKACATLCARGGLPLAFCQLGICGEGAEAPLILDQDGRAFGRAILPLVADPVLLQGRLFEAGDVLRIHAPLSAVCRL